MLDSLKDIYSILWVDLRNLSRHWRSTLATSLIQPLLYLVAFGYGLGRGISFGGVSYLAFVIPGIVALTAFSSSFNGSAQKLQVDRLFYKSFDEFLISPVSLYSLVIGKSLIGVVRGLISSVAILVVGLILLPTLIVSPVFALTLFLSCFVFALFGVLVASLFNNHVHMSTFNTLVILPMTFLCGTFFSLTQVPEAVKIALYCLPLTHSSECLRAAALGQLFPWLSFLALIGFGLIFFSASFFVLKKTVV
ncbi:MAG: ABC transporter permease [Candidatus Bathyarchaeia archaeon]|jgi:ABC-type multidrug transport system permease subunit